MTQIDNNNEFDVSVFQKRLKQLYRARQKLERKVNGKILTHKVVCKESGVQESRLSDMLNEKSTSACLLIT